MQLRVNGKQTLTRAFWTGMGWMGRELSLMGEKPGFVREGRPLDAPPRRQCLHVRGEVRIIEWRGRAVGITTGASQFAQRGVS